MLDCGGMEVVGKEAEIQSNWFLHCLNLHFSDAGRCLGLRLPAEMLQQGPKVEAPRIITGRAKFIASSVRSIG